MATKIFCDKCQREILRDVWQQVDFGSMLLSTAGDFCSTNCLLDFAKGLIDSKLLDDEFHVKISRMKKHKI